MTAPLMMGGTRRAGTPKTGSRRQQEARERVAARRAATGWHDALERQQDEKMLARIRTGQIAPQPWRITRALDVRELYGPEVDRALGVEEPTVDEWEAGLRVPTLAQVKALADLTLFTWRWFYQAEPPPQTGGMFVCGPGAPGYVDVLAAAAERDRERLVWIAERRATGEQGVLL